MKLNRTFLALCRTLHIYLTMFGLLVMMLFGVTGFTLNHEDWFGATRPLRSRSVGQAPSDLIRTGDGLHLVEYLRQTFHITGALTDFADLGDRFSAGFKAPGQSWDVEIEKASGAATVRKETYNFAALINDLHRGHEAGPIWSWIIDSCAILLTLACVTGLILWLSLPKRRALGIAILALGAAVIVVTVALFVPGPDRPLPASRSATGPAGTGAVQR